MRRFLTLVLGEAGTGIVRVLRSLSLSWTVERALRSAVASQAAQTWDANKYNRDLHGRAVMEEAVDAADGT